MEIFFIIIFAAGMLFICERISPASKLANVKGWWLRAVLLNCVQASISFLAAQTWDKWLPHLSIFELDIENNYLAAAIGYILITFIYYWWHRARHEIPLLWRWMHQVHHSASRLEVVTSFYKHPFEIFANGLLSSFILYSLLSLPAQAAALAVTLTGLAELFYHCNIKTPYWLGFLFQRPESHRVHHQRGLHKYNYSDLPLWDILFGTFHNPRVSPKLVGYSGQKERQLLRMLFGKQPTS